MKRESYKKKILAAMDHLSSDYHIAEDEWITPEMYSDNSEEGKKKLEYYKRNKLRGNWFQTVVSECQEAVMDLINDQDLKNNLDKKIKSLINEFHSTVNKEGKINRELVEKAEKLMEEIKGYLTGNKEKT